MCKISLTGEVLGTLQAGARCPEVHNEWKNLICFGELNKDGDKCKLSYARYYFTKERTIHSPYSGRREAGISGTILEQGFKSRSVCSTPDRTGCDESVTQRKK